MWGFYRGKATRAFAKTQVMNEAGVVGDAAPFEVARAVVLIVQQFLHMLRQ